jgi:hypothetical protein
MKGEVIVSIGQLASRTPVPDRADIFDRGLTARLLCHESGGAIRMVL